MAGGSLAYFDSLSVGHNLDGSSSSNPLLLAGATGLDMPPFALLDQRTPQQPGTTVRYVDLLPKTITLPLAIVCLTESAFYTQRRAMLDTWFANPGGWLRSTDPSGINRDMDCQYLAGLEGDESDANRGPGHMQVALQLLAPYPLWHDTVDTVVGPFTNTQLLAGVTINNAGSYLTYPTWVFASPMTNLVITNTTTGLAIKLTANGGLSMVAGHTLTINSVACTVVEDATNQISFLTTDSIFFPLVPGNNAITFAYTGGLLGTTTGTFNFRQQYRSR